MTDPTHLNIIKTADGHFHVEVVQGADRIVITPTLDTRSDAERALVGIQSWTRLPVGRYA